MGANIKFIVKRSVGIVGSMFSALSIVLSIWSWEELGIIGAVKLFILVALVLLSVVGAVFWTLVSKRKKNGSKEMRLLEFYMVI